VVNWFVTEPSYGYHMTAQLRATNHEYPPHTQNMKVHTVLENSETTIQLTEEIGRKSKRVLTSFPERFRPSFEFLPGLCFFGRRRRTMVLVPSTSGLVHTAQPLMAASRAFTSSAVRTARQPPKAKGKANLHPLDYRNIPDFKWDDVPFIYHLKLEQDRLRLRFQRLINYQLPELKRE
jgi:hypothetical protein